MKTLLIILILVLLGGCHVPSNIVIGSRNQITVSDGSKMNLEPKTQTEILKYQNESDTIKAP